MKLLTWNPVDGSQRPQHPHGPDGGQVQLVDVEAVLQGAERQREKNGGHDLSAPSMSRDRKKIILWSPRCARRRARRQDGYFWPCGSLSPGRLCRKNEQPENNISLERFPSLEKGLEKGSQFRQEKAQILGKSSPLFSIPKPCLFPFPPYFPKVVPAAERPRDRGRAAGASASPPSFLTCQKV